MPRRNRRRFSRKSPSITYCSHTDDGGYCCTNTSRPGAMWCEVHSMMGDGMMGNQVMNYFGFRPARTPDNAYRQNSLPSLWTNPYTAQASQDALEHPKQPEVKPVSLTVSSTGTGGAKSIQSKQQAALSSKPSGWWALAMPPPTQFAPAKPLTPLKEALKSSGRLFTFMLNHYGQNWIEAVAARPANSSNTAQKKLVDFINSQSGVDTSHLFDADKTDKEIKLTLDAGVKYFDVFAEVVARDDMEHWHPYIFQDLLNRVKFADPEKRIQKKMDLIDALVEEKAAIAGASFASLKTRVLLWVESKGITITFMKNDDYRAVKPIPLPPQGVAEYNTDMLMGYASEAAVKAKKIVSKDLDMSNPSQLVKTVLQRYVDLDAILCTNSSTGQNEPCTAWVFEKAQLLKGVLTDWNDYITKNAPPFAP